MKSIFYILYGKSDYFIHCENPDSSNLATRACSRSAHSSVPRLPENLLQLLQVLEIIRDDVAAVEFKLNSRILGSVWKEYWLYKNLVLMTLGSLGNFRSFRSFRSLRSSGMQNGSQIRPPASDHGLYIAEGHQHVPENSSGSGENPGEVLLNLWLRRMWGLVQPQIREVRLFGSWWIWPNVKRCVLWIQDRTLPVLFHRRWTLSCARCSAWLLPSGFVCVSVLSRPVQLCAMPSLVSWGRCLLYSASDGKSDAV